MCVREDGVLFTADSLGFAHAQLSWAFGIVGVTRLLVEQTHQAGGGEIRG